MKKRHAIYKYIFVNRFLERLDLYTAPPSIDTVSAKKNNNWKKKVKFLGEI